MYVRCDADCNPTAVQPNSVLVQDVYGNSFRNWCADYQGCDITPGNVVNTNCSPQDAYTWQPTTYDDVGVSRTPSPYNEPPLFPTVFTGNVIKNPDGTDAILVLGLDQDRDLVVVTDGVQQAVMLEPTTTVLPNVAYNHNNP